MKKVFLTLALTTTAIFTTSCSNDNQTAKDLLNGNSYVLNIGEEGFSISADVRFDGDDMVVSMFGMENTESIQWFDNGYLPENADSTFVRVENGVIVITQGGKDVGTLIEK